MRLQNDRYEFIKAKVVNMFKKYNINSIPVDCFEICKKMFIEVKPYSKLGAIGLEKAMSVSSDGFCMMHPMRICSIKVDSWYIFYNDSMLKERIRFTIMHEIGHIVLDHSEHSELAEAEANFFAKYALAPPHLFIKYRLMTMLTLLFPLK